MALPDFSFVLPTLLYNIEKTNGREPMLLPHQLPAVVLYLLSWIA